jgi:hypothetical protein
MERTVPRILHRQSLHALKDETVRGVRTDDLSAIRKQLKNHERTKLLVVQWIDLATELSNFPIKQNRK